MATVVPFQRVERGRGAFANVAGISRGATQIGEALQDFARTRAIGQATEEFLNAENPDPEGFIKAMAVVPGQDPRQTALIAQPFVEQREKQEAQSRARATFEALQQTGVIGPDVEFTEGAFKDALDVRAATELGLNKEQFGKTFGLSKRRADTAEGQLAESARAAKARDVTQRRGQDIQAGTAQDRLALGRDQLAEEVRSNKATEGLRGEANTIAQLSAQAGKPTEGTRNVDATLKLYGLPNNSESRARARTLVTGANAIRKQVDSHFGTSGPGGIMTIEPDAREARNITQARAERLIMEAGLSASEAVELAFSQVRSGEIISPQARGSEQGMVDYLVTARGLSETSAKAYIVWLKGARETVE